MKKYCPIVRINLPYAEYGIAHMYYCERHSLTAEVSPMNEYQIERLKEEALLGFKEKGCKIHSQIKEYDFHDWMQNKEAYLLDINDFNNLTKGEIHAMLSGAPGRKINRKGIRKYAEKECPSNGPVARSYDNINCDWLGAGLLSK